MVGQSKPVITICRPGFKESTVLSQYLQDETELHTIVYYFIENMVNRPF
jgi:hypothetical protein